MDESNNKKNCKICNKECIPSLLLKMGTKVVYLCNIKCYKTYLNKGKLNFIIWIFMEIIRQTPYSIEIFF